MDYAKTQMKNFEVRLKPTTFGRELHHQRSLFHDTNSSTLLDKLVDFVEQTRRLCFSKQY